MSVNWIALHLADGRTVEIPSAGDKEPLLWFACVDGGGRKGDRWWSNGVVAAILASPPRPLSGRLAPISPMLALPSVPATVAVTGEPAFGITISRLDPGPVWVDDRFMPLVCHTGGVQPEVTTRGGPVFGRLDGEIVAAIAPLDPRCI